MKEIKRIFPYHQPESEDLAALSVVIYLPDTTLGGHNYVQT